MKKISLINTLKITFNTKKKINNKKKSKKIVKPNKIKNITKPK